MAYEFEEDDDNLMGMLEDVVHSRLRDSAFDDDFQRKMQRGKERLEANNAVAQQVVDEIFEEEGQKVDSRLQLASFNKPALEMDFDPELIEKVVVMAMAGASVTKIAREINGATPENDRMAITKHMVRSMLASNEGQRLRAEFTKYAVSSAKDALKINAPQAVQRLVAIAGSDNEKLALSAVKAIIQLAGVGEEAGTSEKGNTIQTAEQEQLMLLAKALTGEVK